MEWQQRISSPLGANVTPRVDIKNGPRAPTRRHFLSKENYCSIFFSNEIPTVVFYDHVLGRIQCNKSRRQAGSLFSNQRNGIKEEIAIEFLFVCFIVCLLLFLFFNHKMLKNILKAIAQMIV
jgi:hypothetical protein